MSLITEVDRIRDMYSYRDQDPEIKAMWAPFAEDEVLHRTQQYWMLATLFRSIHRDDLAGLKILDVGCGNGRVLRSFLDMGASSKDLSGVDVHVGAIERARLISPELDLRVSNGIDLEFPDSSFDVVTQFVVFSSIFSSDLRVRLAAEILRVVRSGGYILWWDIDQTAQSDSPSGLDPNELFPGQSCRKMHVGLHRNPSNCVKVPRAFHWFLPLLDILGYRKTHMAALVGPKL